MRRKELFFSLALILSGFLALFTATDSLHSKASYLAQSTEYPAEPRSDTFDQKDKTGDFQGHDIEETDFV